MTYTCPVCGYDELPYPPEDWMICPCCNTMFEYSEVTRGFDALRRNWIETGAKWGTNDVPRPTYWSPISQLQNIGYDVTDVDRVAIARAQGETSFAPIIFNGVFVMNLLAIFKEDQQNNIINFLPENRTQIVRQSQPIDSQKINWSPG